MISHEIDFKIFGDGSEPNQTVMGKLFQAGGTVIEKHLNNETLRLYAVVPFDHRSLL